MDDATNLVFVGGFILFTLIVSIVMIMGLWKVLRKQVFADGHVFVLFTILL